MNRELDCLIIGFAFGALLFLWVGYALRGRVERWRRRSAPPQPRRDARAPHVSRVASHPVEQSARRVLRDKPRIIPLTTRGADPVPDAAADFGGLTDYAIPPAWTDAVPDHVKRLEAEGARSVREDAIAALVGTGFKQATSTSAVDACTLEERAAGLDSWVAAAFRRVLSKP